MLPDLETAPFEPKKGASRLPDKKSVKLLKRFKIYKYRKY